ncbi:MAG: N-acetyltransferase [Chloroflexota bacterium]
MNDLIIRDCTPQDIDEIIQLDVEWEQEAITHGFDPMRREEYLAYLNQVPVYFLVAETFDEVVGYINGSIHINKDVAAFPEGETYLQVDNIYLKPAFRDKGLGSQLMKRLLTTAEQQGIKKYLVESVSTDMAKVINFYQSHDFTLSYVQLFREIE